MEYNLDQPVRQKLFEQTNHKISSFWIKFWKILDFYISTFCNRHYWTALEIWEPGNQTDFLCLSITNDSNTRKSYLCKFSSIHNRVWPTIHVLYLNSDDKMHFERRGDVFTSLQLCCFISHCCLYCIVHCLLWKSRQKEGEDPHWNLLYYNSMQCDALHLLLNFINTSPPRGALHSHRDSYICSLWD